MTSNTIAAAEHHAREGRLGEAEALCRRLLADEPGNTDAVFLQAAVLLLQRRYAESEDLLTGLLARVPGHVEALNNLGVIALEHHGDFPRAEELFTKVLEARPGHVRALNNLGNVFLKTGRIERAEEVFRRVIEMDPAYIDALNNLGAVYVRRGEIGEGIRCYRKVLEHAPESPEVLANLIVSENAMGNMDATADLMERILALRAPGLALYPAFSAAKTFCRWDLLPEVQTAVLDGIFRGEATVRSFETMNLSLLASPDISEETLLAVHRITGQVVEKGRQADPFIEHAEAFKRTGKLRIGYLSADFRQHVVSSSFRGLINNHDRDCFEIFCYSNVRREDATTEEYRESADAFIDVTEMSDAECAKRIHDDGIQILVDLGGYTRDGRIAVLSYRPAPVQILYLGYPFTSGIPAVDYVISDPFLNGPDNARFFTERQLTLPESFLCFDELAEQNIDPDPPCFRNGYITFGSLANPYKLNPRTTAVWSDVLGRVPGACIVLNHPGYGRLQVRDSVRDAFASRGVDGHRIRFVWEKHPGGSHLRYYNDIDICLDTFPLTGGTTTLDTVWMGVPVITLVGRVYHQRLSYSILKNTGADLDFCIAETEEDYIGKAAALAGKPDFLRSLRRDLPDALKTSILCDPVRMTRQIEAAYAEAWNRCAPNAGVRLEPEVDEEHTVALPDGTEIVCEKSLDAMETYILREQRGWLAPEFDFLMGLLKPGMRVLDVGSGGGVHALPAARRVAGGSGGGAVWAIPRTVRDAAYLEAGRRRNGLSNLHIPVRADRKILIDRIADGAGIPSVDLVRFNIDARDAWMVGEARRFLERNRPIIVAGARRDNARVDTAVIAALRPLGFRPYRLLPGLGCLVPVSDDEALDVFTVNLFCLADPTAKELEARGIVVGNTDAPLEIPGIDAGEWRNLLRGPWADGLREHWSDGPLEIPEWEAYRVALNMYARFRQEQRDPSERVAYLGAASGILSMLLQVATNLPRLLSSARIFSAFGRRREAVEALGAVIELWESGPSLAVDEPFVPVSEASEAMSPGGRVADWLLGSVLEERERLRALSTYFTGDEARGPLETAERLGFLSHDGRRRIALIRERYGG